MINFSNSIYCSILFCFTLLLTQCGSAEFVDETLGRIEKAFEEDDDTSSYAKKPLIKPSLDSHVTVDTPEQAVRSGFVCDGGREIAIHFINDGYCDCEDGTDEEISCETLAEEAFLRPNAHCTASKVNMRSSPEIIDNVVGLLDKNQRVVVLEDITGNDPNVGVMNRNHTIIYDGSDEPVGRLRKNQAVRIVGEYQGYDESGYYGGEYIDVLNLETTEKGKKVTYIGIPRTYFTSYYGQTWYKVETEEGESGWVSGDFIEFE
ncbi:MAG: hypothetical protein ACPGYR_05725 [Chitinophagales bacterium]